MERNIMTITLDGGIGPGKSLIGSRLEQHGYTFVHEPVDHPRWQQAQTLFYSDMQRWAYYFQTVAFTLRAQTWREIVGGVHGDPALVISERSVWTDRFVFAPMLANNGIMRDCEFAAYHSLWGELPHSVLVKPAGIIYLQTTSDVALERIRQRGRPSEQGITADYLDALHHEHRRYLKMMAADDVMIAMVDAGRDVDSVLTDVLRAVERFTKELPPTKPLIHSRTP